VCAQEFPELQSSIAEPYGPQGVTVIGIAAGGFGESEATLRDFVATTGVQFDVVVDDGSYDLWDFPGALSPFPRQVLIGAGGSIAYVASEHRQSDLEAAVRATLGLDD